jgi:8-oxo-dGTP diphosphatase
MALKLPLEQFLETFTWAPRLALCVHVQNSRGEVALAQRAIEPGKGSWHYPGSFLLKDEPLRECLARVLESELGIVRSDFNSELIGLFENLDRDPRGHVVDAVYRITYSDDVVVNATQETQSAAFFAKIPEDMAFGHDTYLESLGFLRDSYPA